jgi:hypothetical protein
VGKIPSSYPEILQRRTIEGNRKKLRTFLWIPNGKYGKVEQYMP